MNKYQFYEDINVEDDYVNAFLQARRKIEEIWKQGYDVSMELVVESSEIKSEEVK